MLRSAMRLAAAAVFCLAWPLAENLRPEPLPSGAANSLADSGPGPSLMLVHYPWEQTPDQARRDRNVREIPKTAFAPGRNAGLAEKSKQHFFWWMLSRDEWKVGIGGDAVPAGLLDSGSPVEGGFGGLRAEYLPRPGRLAFSLTTGMGGVRATCRDTSTNIVVLDPMLSAHFPVSGFVDLVLGAGGWWGMTVPMSDAKTMGGFGANAELRFRWVGL